MIDELNKVSGFPIPNAIEEIRNAEIRHTTECDVDKMKETVQKDSRRVEDRITGNICGV